MEYLLNAIPKAKHHSALPWPEVPALCVSFGCIARLRPKRLAVDQPHSSVREGGARCDRSEIKSSSELEQIAKLPNHLVQGETWVAPAEPMKEGKEHHVSIPPEAFALIAGRKGKLLPGHESQMLDLLTSRF